MNYCIKNGNIVGEEKVFVGDILIIGDKISKISETAIEDVPEGTEIIDATGKYVLPGIIDTHVHFREPGLTNKADIESESRAAAYGGVTSYFDMPNCKPQTTDFETLAEKQKLAAEKSHVNYAFFFGATTENTHLFKQIDKRTTPGVKLFMGSSTGNMLVDDYKALANIFKTAKEYNLLVMAHCESNDIIQEQTKEVKKLYGDDADVSLHPIVRNREACTKSALEAFTFAKMYRTKLHIAHISTAEEATVYPEAAEFLDLPITFEACLPHIVFNDSDYATRGTRIKCNTAVKTAKDQQAIIAAIKSGKITTIATDHAPHTWEEKQGGCLTATSGMPMLQFSLISMLELFTDKTTNAISDEDVMIISRQMSSNPATLFRVEDRGLLKEGYKADIAIVSKTDEPWTLTKADIQSKCGWSPLEGDQFHWKVQHTFCNGNHILNDGVFDPSSRGEQIIFHRRPFKEPENTKQSAWLNFSLSPNSISS